MNNIELKLRPFILLIFGIIGFLLIFFQSDITDSLFLAQALPTMLVIVYSIILGYLLKFSNSYDEIEHYADSIYFLGFLFTLVSIFCLFSKYNWYEINELSNQNNIVNFVGIALLTTVFGIVGRNIVKSLYMNKAQDLDYSNYMKKLEKVEKEFSEFSKEYKGIFIIMTEYITDRKEEIKRLNKIEKEYFSNLEKFNNMIEEFNENLDIQQRILQVSSEFMPDLESSIGHFANLETNVKNVVTVIKGFNESVTDLDTVLDDFIEIIKIKINKLKK